jgi:hypothetical protein
MNLGLNNSGRHNKRRLNLKKKIKKGVGSDISLITLRVPVSCKKGI